MRYLPLIAAASVAGVMLTAAHADQGGAAVMEQMQQLAQTSDPQDFRNAEIDFEYDIAKCAAYYNLEAALATKSGYGNTDAGRGMSQAAQAATQYTLEISNAIGMSMDAVKAQLNIDTTEIARQLGKDYVNTPLVLQTVGLPCKTLLENPMARMAHWVKVEREKDGHSRGH